ncbi:4-alpha-glucanotransferase [Thermithiobacillus tepidarius DSM 3134]|uniref:4-alpha-glucanotransferase n=1 Tax=Thermithiobacillus tepidarius TaxID=929 RepID=UPI00041222E8|nr:4-alpha-glucanotransferase [Thermithiobacillus tepidarius]
MNEQEALDRLCALCGIDLAYTDIWGKTHPASDQTKRALLAAMHVPAGSEAELRQSLEELESKAWRRLLPPVLVLRRSEPAPRIPLTVPAERAERAFRWALLEEGGQRHGGECRPAELEVLERRQTGAGDCVRYALPLPFLPADGYHRFELEEVEDPSHCAAMSLIIAPDACYQPPAVAGAGRVWGPAVQLYTLRSGRNWGIGDFSDLQRVVELSAELGASLVGLNPLHALFPHNLVHASPYSPSSRLFLNVLYLDVEAVPDFAESESARALVRSPVFQELLQAQRAGELVDYAAVGEAKLRVLSAAYSHFREHHLQQDSERGRAFRRFQAEGGEMLRMQALFEALQEHFHQENPEIWGWPVWPPAYRHPGSAEVREFAAAHEARVEFFEYLQWQADLQLGAAGRRCLELGLGVGLYQDLAVSVDRGGAEAWANQDLYAVDASVGAPPDAFNMKGQDWGLPPLIPERLREAAYAPFIATLRENMRHAGALRIDHVMALMRLFWVPPGNSAAEGTYVNYPLADLLGILALESQRNRCLVIGEDLGTVPDAVRDALGPLGVLSYRLLIFERHDDGSFKAPGEYPRQALVAVSTHDLPTLAGYWQGVDLELRSALHLFPSAEAGREQYALREQDRAQLLAALQREGLLPEGLSTDPRSVPAVTPEFARAVHVYLARSPAQVMLVQLEDVFGQSEQVNLPGTTDQHPNWRRKLTVGLEQWAQDGRLAALAEALRRERSPAAGEPQNSC